MMYGCTEKYSTQGGVLCKYSTQLCLVLYLPLDPTPRIVFSIHHSQQCFNIYGHNTEKLRTFVVLTSVCPIPSASMCTHVLCICKPKSVEWALKVVCNGKSPMHFIV